MQRKDVDDFLVWATIGVVLGGRTGYVLFYQPGYYFAHPLQILELRHGGMSFHGGALGGAVAIVLFTVQRRISLLGFADIIICAVPIGLFFGRIANFINGELWGRVTDVAWAMVFPTGGRLPRHPSELYEAFLKGIVLFTILFYLQHFTRSRERRGALTGGISHGLCHCPHHRRVLPAAGRLSGLHPARRHNGPTPVASVAGDRVLSATARL